jgi:hypothetical protein
MLKAWHPWGQFMNMEEALMEENEDLIDKVGFWEMKEIDIRFYVIF